MVYRNYFLVLLVISVIFVTGNLADSFAQEDSVPDWIRQVAIWWGEGQISTQEYLDSISFLIEDEVIEVPGFVNVKAQTLEEQSAAELWSAIDNLQNQVDELKKQTSSFEQVTGSESKSLDPDCWKFNEENLRRPINRDLTGDGKVDERDCIYPKIYLRASPWDQVRYGEGKGASCDDGDIAIGGTWVWADSSSILNQNKKFGDPVRAWLGDMEHYEVGGITQTSPQTGYSVNFKYAEPYYNDEYNDLYVTEGGPEKLPIVRIFAVCAHLGNIIQYEPAAADEVLVGSEVTGVTPDPFTSTEGLVALDADGDGISNEYDNCVNRYNADQKDSDNDGYGDRCDMCPYDFDNDVDGDHVCVGEGHPDHPGTKSFDNCPYTPNYKQEDTDGDGVGDACDRADPLEPQRGSLDSDGDGIADNIDNCPNTPEDKNGYQDTDGCPDGRGN